MHGQARAETVRGGGGRGPRAVRHPWRLAALLLAAVGVTAGCQPLQLLGFMFSSDLSQAPKCPLTIPGKEAFRPAAYRDPAGIPTLGYGETLSPAEAGTLRIW